jgi:hypothetical protein
MNLLAIGLLACLVIFVIVGVVIVQARVAAQHWRRVVAEGDQEALDELLDRTFEGWRNSRLPRGTPPSDWRALTTAAIVAADRDRVRVSLLVDEDVRVIGGERVEVGSADEVAQRTAVRMVERLLYEAPFVSFDRVQVDVLREFRSEDGNVHTPCLLSTRVDRETASWSDWEHGDVNEILGEWDTRVRAGSAYVDPDRDAIIAPEDLEAVRALEAAEQTLRRPTEGDR